METFSALLAICAENSPVPGEFPHKGQWRGALMFTLICARIKGWVNNCEAGDLRRNRAHYDVIVMGNTKLFIHENAFENVIFESGSLLSSGRWVNSLRPSDAYMCVVKLTIIGSDNGLSPGRCQATIWSNAGILLIGRLGTNFSEILIGIQTFSFKKMHLKMSSAKWRSFCFGLNVLSSKNISTSRSKSWCFLFSSSSN